MSDLIRKQDAIDALKKYEELESNNFTDTSPISMMTVATIANCIEEIINIPSAEPERRKGKWIEQDDGWDGVYYECSCCKEAFTLLDGTPSDNLYNFCPNCGADLRGER